MSNTKKSEKRDVVYWDRFREEIVFEREAIKPPETYIILRKGIFDGVIVEYYKDGDKQLEFSYTLITPKQKVSMLRTAHLQKYAGDWLLYKIDMPKKELKRYIREFYEGK